MNCCDHNQGLNALFNERVAQDEAREYLRKGLDKSARRLADAIAARGVQGTSLLEIGGGIGGLHLELLKRGAARALDVDVSSGYIAAAQSVAETLGLRDKVEYRQADFTAEAAAIPEADVVLMHRVVCCYPDMPGLVGAAARRARRQLALSFPTGAWYMRLAGKFMNAGMWLSRSGFRFYVHPPAAILQTIRDAGLTLVQQTASWPWRIVIFERA
jgi:magnesium-protoporphyrin O-methyltransferase